MIGDGTTVGLVCLQTSQPKKSKEKILVSVSQIDHMGIVSVSLSTVFSLEPPNLLPLRKFMIPCQEVPDQPKEVHKASLKIP